MPSSAIHWLAGFLILGTWLFGDVYRGELTPANKPDVQPAFQPFFYTLDLLLPVVSLHQRDAWIAHGAAQVRSVVFIIMGWILATAVVLSLTASSRETDVQRGTHRRQELRSAPSIQREIFAMKPGSPGAPRGIAC